MPLLLFLLPLREKVACEAGRMRGFSDLSFNYWLLRGLENSPHHAIRRRDFAVWKTKNPESLLRKPGITNCVVLRVVERTVDLDHQPDPKAHEVYEIRAERKLTPELQGRQSTAPQQLPKKSLVRRCATPQSARLTEIGRAHV